MPGRLARQMARLAIDAVRRPQATVPELRYRRVSPARE
jgi:hypothetical protein